MADPQSEEPRKVLPTLITWLGLMAATLIPLFAILSPYMVSVLTGLVLAVVFYPAYARLRRHLPRWAAALVVTLGAIGLVVIPISLLAVGAFRQGATVLAQVSTGEAPTITELIERLQAWLPSASVIGTPDEIRVMMQPALNRLSQVASGVVIRELQALPSLLVQLVLIALSTYFLLVDGRALFRWIAERIPLSAHIRRLLVDSFQGATTSVVLASVVAAATQSLVLLIGFWALSVPSALLGAGSAFVLAWIPTFGTLPVWSSAALYLYISGSTTRAIIMVVIGLVVGLVDNIVRPLVLRGRQAMHPMVSLLAIFGGLTTFGLTGVFLGPLLASVSISLLELWPAVASFCGIPVSGSGEDVPEVPMVAQRTLP